MFSGHKRGPDARTNRKNIDHQRPDGVKGEWELLPSWKWNRHQQLAAATNGWATLASVTSVTGGVVTARGIHNTAEGIRKRSWRQAALGVGQIIIGRSADLADGALAAKFGVRGRTGAFVDATIDKSLTAYAEYSLARAGVIPTEVAALHISQQVIIVAENAAIHHLGGEANPRWSSKYGMFSVWTGSIFRSSGRLAEETGKEKLGHMMTDAGTAADTAAAALNGLAIIENARTVHELLSPDPHSVVNDNRQAV